jgi:hypothetical protein
VQRLHRFTQTSAYIFSRLHWQVLAAGLSRPGDGADGQVGSRIPWRAAAATTAAHAVAAAPAAAASVAAAGLPLEGEREIGKEEGREIGGNGWSNLSIPTGLGVIQCNLHFGKARDEAM